MKTKVLLLTLIIAMAAFVTSCDSDGSKSSDGGYEQEEFIQIGNHDNTPTGPIYYSTDGEFAVDFSSSAITYQRASCSGFDGGTTDNIENGCYATIKFSQDQVDWAKSPSVVSPSEAVIYRAECITPEDTTN